jgi:UDP-N-acetylmuramate--alanine ligase
MGHSPTTPLGRGKRVHFVGIGGVGMAGVAEVLVNLGYCVTGSDVRESSNTRRLRALGATVALGHRECQVDGSDVVVASSAVAADNPEMIAARRLRIPIVPRAQMLGELMRLRQGIAVAGTHGKTTTTSLVASLLAEGGFDPTFVIGGCLNSAGSNGRLGAGRYLVAEADESDASFLYLQPWCAVVTNIDADHIRAYGGDFGRLREAFKQFVHHVSVFGLVVACLDDPVVRTLLPEISRPLVTYGLGAEADLRARGIRQRGLQTHFQLVTREDGDQIDITLKLPGRHNVLNALAAIAVARHVNVSWEAICSSLAGFQGIGRRLQVYGEHSAPGGTVLLVDDYGHHPREISASLQAIRAGWPGRRLVVAFQPHRFTRTCDLFEDFVKVLSDLEPLVLLDVYPAGESPIPGADGAGLLEALRRRGAEPLFVERVESLPSALESVVEDGDVLLLLGAGDIGTVAPLLNVRWRMPQVSWSGV